MEITTLAEPIADAQGTDETATRIKVEKRDGRVVDFDRLNIYNAIAAAYKELHKPIGGQERRIIEAMVDQVESEIADRYTKPVKIEDIQNLVEHELINEHEYDVARAYTSYRLNRDIERSKATDINEAVKRLTSRDESLVRENANKDSNVYATQRDLLAGAVSKATAFSMLPKDVSNAHMKGDIHFHDADYSPFTAQSNCSLPDFGDMLEHGFALGNAMMDSPKSIMTASTQITQIIKDIASSQYGGQTVNRCDEMMSRYAEIDYRKNLDMASLVMPDGMPLDAAQRLIDALREREPKALHLEDGKTIAPDVPNTAKS